MFLSVAVKSGNMDWDWSVDILDAPPVQPCIRRFIGECHIEPGSDRSGQCLLPLSAEAVAKNVSQKERQFHLS